MKRFLSLYFVVAAAVAMVGLSSHAGDANALFLKSALDKAKDAGSKLLNKVEDTASDAEKKAKEAAKTAVNGVTGAANAAAGGAKRLFEKATVAVVNLAKKAKLKASDLLKNIEQKGQYLFYKILGGEYRRLQKKLLRANSAGAMKNGRAGSSFGVTSSTAAATASLNPEGDAANPDVPTAIAKYADWYNYKAGDVQPPKSVSRREKQSLIKDQGMRGTCAAFATTAAMEAALGKTLLSQEYMYWLFKNGDKSKICNEAEDGVTFPEATAGLAANGVPREVHYVYLPWRGFDFAKLCPAGPTALAKKLADYKAEKIYSFPWRSSGKGATIANPRFIEAAIDAGYEIVSAFDVTFMEKNMGILGGWFFDSMVDPDTGTATKAPGGHAMLIVGYDRSGNDSHGGGHIIVKNSWGALWGDGGYVKLSYDYVRQYAGDAFILHGVK